MISLSLLLSLSACLLWTGAEGQVQGDLRLVARNGQTRSSLTAGRLEVYYSGQWGTVCDDNFGRDEAIVACRQLGFSDGYLYYSNVGFSFPRFTAASRSTRTWFDSLNCPSTTTTTTTRLIDCASAIGIHNCDIDHTEDVVLYCEGNGAMRLSSSVSASSGRVEVYNNGAWVSVCDDSFSQTDANVACQQLGFSSATNYGTVSSLGYNRGSGTTWLRNPRCTSSDLMLSTCSNSGFVSSIFCSHFDDAAVVCNSLSTDIGGAIASAVIAGIVIAVVVPLCCIGICVTIIVIAVCTGACAAGAASSRSRRRNINVATTTTPAAAVVTTTGSAGVNAPPPYPGTAYPSQPQAAPGAYPQQAGGGGYPPYPAAPQQPYPDEQKVELQQYPAGPAYPPQPAPTQPYPTDGYPPPTNQ